TSSDRLNSAFWSILDANKDGKLSKEEFAAAPKLLAKLDENEDEMLVAGELNPDQNYAGVYAVPVAYTTPTAPRTPQVAVFQEIAPDASLDALARQVLTFYDKNKDGKLSPAEMALEKARFDALDKNKDGFLDAVELQGFFAGEPDLTFRGQIGQPAKGTVAGLLARV